MVAEHGEIVDDDAWLEVYRIKYEDMKSQPKKRQNPNWMKKKKNMQLLGL